jgi:Ca-activated chloride channel homolog
MEFIWPSMLALLVTIPLFVALYLLLQRRRNTAIATHSGFGLLANQAGRQLGARRHIPLILFLAGMTVLITALARPQMVVTLPKVAGTLILAFDVSGSMAAEDLQPNRMEAAKAVAADFVKRQPITVQVGVVAFSDSGISVQPPTNDQEATLAAIARLKPERGTSLANGITAALKAIEVSQAREIPSMYTNLTPMPTPTPTVVPPGTHTSAAIVLLTDGENTVNPDPLAAAQIAAERGVRIHTIGIGSPAGINLEVNGLLVHTQLDEAVLKKISLLTDGAYYNAQNEDDLRAIYANINPQLVIKDEKTEVTSLFAGLSGLILLLGGALSLLWFGRVP